MCRNRRWGQTIIEGVALSVIVAAALLAMKGYMKRGLAGGYRTAANSIGEQYDPRKTTAESTTVAESKSLTESTLVRGDCVDNCQDADKANDVKANVMHTKTTVEKDVTTRKGKETIEAPGSKLFD